MAAQRATAPAHPSQRRLPPRQRRRAPRHLGSSAAFLRAQADGYHGAAAPPPATNLPPTHSSLAIPPSSPMYNTVARRSTRIHPYPPSPTSSMAARCPDPTCPTSTTPDRIWGSPASTDATSRERHHSGQGSSLRCEPSGGLKHLYPAGC
ncbi:hypothetical protein ZWY2020_039580 [Hordeum vulgare]|nr:hypothetical protein ZWY2020_039579 [Hordeum vulgare]KAI4991209.1 hypothetical protein ZWY2020_039580 [Hordeum vulgare]